VAVVQSASRANLWRNHDFLKLWSGETVAQVGAQITQLALPLLVLGMLSGSATEVGLVAAAQQLPALCVTPFAGLLIDSFDRRSILLLVNSGRAVALLMVPVLYFTDGLSIPALCVIAFTVGACTAVFDVAYMSYLPAIVSRPNLVEANSKLQASYSIAQIGGPGIGGVLIKALGAWFAILVNVVTYVGAFFAILTIRHREPAPDRTSPDRPKLSDILTSFGLLWRNPVLRVLTGQSGWFNFCEQAILTLFLIYAVRELGMDAGGVGIVLALGSVASLAGAVLARRLGDYFGFPMVLVATIGVASWSPLLLVLTGGSAWSSYALCILMFATYGLGLTIYNVHVVAFRQTVIPTEVLGRATAAYRMLTYGPFPIGAFLGGLLGEEMGLRPALLLFAVVSVLGWVAFALAARNLKDAAHDPAESGGSDR
jgi:MFS family permease